MHVITWNNVCSDYSLMIKQAACIILWLNKGPYAIITWYCLQKIYSTQQEDVWIPSGSRKFVFSLAGSKMPFNVISHNNKISYNLIEQLTFC